MSNGACCCSLAALSFADRCISVYARVTLYTASEREREEKLQHEYSVRMKGRADGSIDESLSGH